MEGTKTFCKPSCHRARGREATWSLVSPMFRGGRLGQSRTGVSVTPWKEVASLREHEHDSDVTSNWGP